MAGTQDNLKGAIEKSWDFIKDSSIRISFEAFKTYRITRLKFEKNGIKKSMDAKYREIGEITHNALKEGEAYLICGNIRESKMIQEGAISVTFEIHLEKGPADLECWFARQRMDEGPSGAYFVEANYLE